MNEYLKSILEAFKEELILNLYYMYEQCQSANCHKHRRGLRIVKV